MPWQKLIIVHPVRGRLTPITWMREAVECCPPDTSKASIAQLPKNAILRSSTSRRLNQPPKDPPPYAIGKFKVIHYPSGALEDQVRETSRLSGSSVQWTSSIHQRPSVRISVK